MKVGYFTKHPYRWVAEDDVLQNHAFFALPNQHFEVREKLASSYQKA